MPLEAWLIALGSAFLFAAGLIVTQIGLRYTTPGLGAAVSMPTTLVLFWASAPFTADFSGWRWDAALVFSGIGMFYPVAITILTFEANRLMGPHVTGALGNFGPLVALAAGLLWLGEQLSLGQLIGILIVVAGVTTLSTSRRWAGEEWPGWLVVLPLTGSLVRGLAPVALKYGFMLWPNPRVATLLCYLSSATISFVSGVMRARAAGTWFNARGVKWFMGVGVCNGLATWGTIEAVSRGPVSIVTSVVACSPMFTLGLAALVFGRKEITRRQGVGVALTVAGMLLLLSR